MGPSSVERHANERLMSLARAAGILLLVLTTGCALLERTPSPAGTTPGAEASAPSTTGKGDAKTSATTPVPPATGGQVPKNESHAPGSATPAAPLDLTTLEKRLRETGAIGVFTKLALKNQVDDLVSQFRELHQRRGKPAQLRQSYDLLFLKVLTLLQDSDPPLAKTIVASREAIWGILADPVKFSTI